MIMRPRRTLSSLLLFCSDRTGEAIKKKAYVVQSNLENRDLDKLGNRPISQLSEFFVLTSGLNSLSCVFTSGYN